MNYMKQLNELYSTLDYKPLTAEAIAVYFVLLQIANKTGWIDEFKVANKVLMSKCNISIDVLKTARNNLKTQGYIDYTKGKNQNEAPKYKIIELYMPQADTQPLTQAVPQAETQAPPQPLPHINKQDKTIHKKKNNKKKFGDYENVFFDDEQFEKLKAEFPNDYPERIQKLDDYMQSTGKKYKDCLATIRNWARKDGYKANAQNNNGLQCNEQSEFQEVNTSNLTQEEYMNLVRGGKIV